MKHFKDIKKKIEWEDYYNPAFDWNDWDFYVNNALSEDFIREFKKKVYWLYISKCQRLSENFIREFKDKVNWTYISSYQRLSENFISKFKDKV